MLNRVHRYGLGLALFVSLVSHQAGATSRHIRTTLDDEAVAPPEVAAPQVKVLPESHADFPVTVEPAAAAAPSIVHGRLIRLTLEGEGPETYGRLTKPHPTGRHVRTSLD